MYIFVLILAIAVTSCRGRAVDVREKQNAWELSGHFEGDIILTEEQKLGLRNGLINTNYRWPNRIVPYFIDPVFTEEQKAQILKAVDQYHAQTCIRLREYNPDTDVDYVHIRGGSGCSSSVGRIGGRQYLTLGAGCFQVGTIEHELLHTMGFYHMQSATDRDNYVEIIWDNIEAGKEHNFNKYDASTITSFGVEYDYGSIMHYSAYAFSKNGEPTIVPLDENAQIGQIDGFSARDLEKLAKMYDC
ncbi:zinc metalloproteinase nas-13-like [Periplaneta americana]|uniref:zinc metalloproteinase nas-13-like n=1 Tax=Periplaneta americana TaxID=6978 RepID=UPI0037E71C9A